MSPPSQPSQPSMLADVIASIFTPGTNPGLLRATNLSFFALFASLVFLLVLSGGNLHVWALSAVALALFGSLQFFLSELSKVQSGGVPPALVPDPDGKAAVAPAEDRKVA